MAQILPNAVTRTLRSLEARIWDLERQASRKGPKQEYAIERWSFAGFIYVSDAPPCPYPMAGVSIEFGAALGTAGTSTTTVRFDFGQGTVDLSMTSGVTSAKTKERVLINPQQRIVASVETAGSGAKDLTMYMSYLATPQAPAAVL